jgi:hypothetical protein
LEQPGAGIGPREKLVDCAGEMTVDDRRECVDEIGVRVDVVQLARFDQRGDDRPIFRAGEERVLAREREGPDRSLDRVGVDLDRPVVQEA